MSVAMAACDGSRFIEEQLRSIAEQSRPVDELIVADDASMDDTVAIVERFAAEAALPVKILRQNRRVGFVQNFASALSACDGDIILISDQDDVWRRDRSAVMEGSLGNARSAAFSDALLGGGEFDTLWRRLDFTDKDRRRFARDPYRYLMRGNVVTGATLGFTRDLLDVILPIPDVRFHDYWIGCIAAATGSLTPIALPLISYRQHDGNSSGGAPGAGRLTRARGRLHAGGYGDRMAHFSALTERLSGWNHTASKMASAGERFLTYRESCLTGERQRLSPIVTHLMRGDYHLYSRGAKNAVLDALRVLGLRDRH